MSWSFLKRGSPLKHFISYFSLFCLTLSSTMPSSLCAECCKMVDDQDEQRTKTATIVAGATIIALVGGVAYAVFGTSCHKRHHGHSSNSSSGSHGNSSYGYSSDRSSSSSNESNSSRNSDSSNRSSNHNNSSRSSGSSGSSSRHSSLSDFTRNNSGSWDSSSSSLFTDPLLIERDGMPVRARTLPRSSKRTQKTHQICGVFSAHPGSVSSGQGSATAFVRHPDGTVETLGSIPLSKGSSSNISFGPYTEEGSYLFGMRIDRGTLACAQTKIGSVEVSVNGSTAGSHHFIIPTHLPSSFEPTPFEWQMAN